jgi:hypothetical protein
MTTENFSLRYTLNDDEKHDTLLNLEMNFDNPSDDLFVKRLNTWLKAIGRENLYVANVKKEPVIAAAAAVTTTTTTKSITTTKFNNATKKNEEEIIIIE